MRQYFLMMYPPIVMFGAVYPICRITSIEWEKSYKVIRFGKPYIALSVECHMSIGITRAHGLCVYGRSYH